MEKDDHELLARARLALHAVSAVAPHTDADGLAAAAIALRTRNEPAEAAILLGHGVTPFGDAPPLSRGAFARLDALGIPA